MKFTISGLQRCSALALARHHAWPWPAWPAMVCAMAKHDQLGPAGGVFCCLHQFLLLLTPIPVLAGWPGGRLASKENGRFGWAASWFEIKLPPEGEGEVGGRYGWRFNTVFDVRQKENHRSMAWSVCVVRRALFWLTPLGFLAYMPLAVPPLWLKSTQGRPCFFDGLTTITDTRSGAGRGAGENTVVCDSLHALHLCIHWLHLHDLLDALHLVGALHLCHPLATSS